MKVKSAEFVKGAVSWDGLPKDGRPEVVFLGRSNVGKSTMLNALTRRKKLARTSKRPGKTQEYNIFRINNRQYWIDMPGYGYAKVPKKKRVRWAEFIARYVSERKPLKAIVHLMDSRHPLTDLDRELIDMIRGGAAPMLVVLTKADKLSGNVRRARRGEVEAKLEDVGLHVPLMLTSAEKGDGLGKVLRWIDTLT